MGLFAALLVEHCGPWRGRVGRIDLVIDPPSGEDVARLDSADGLDEVLALLVGDEDLTDELLDELDGAPASDLVDLVVGLRRHWALHRPPPAGLAAVVDEVDRYGAAIEADLILGGTGLLLIDFVREPDRPGCS